jgi:tRNA 5-methylaminomethyl-2-thiouridine biosynthesis bifunctional protein
VIDAAAFRTEYADLQHGRRPDKYQPAPLLPGLFTSSGHGARALVSAWPAAELLAAMIDAEPLPLGSDLVDALNPARFLVRELKRGSGG